MSISVKKEIDILTSMSQRFHELDSLRRIAAYTVVLSSYCVYLWQQLFNAQREYLSGAGEIIPLLLPLLCVVVPLSYFLIEKPAMRYGRYLSRRTAGSSIGAKEAA